MALVMLGEEKLAVDLAAGRIGLQRLFQVGLLKQLVLDPKGDGHAERLEAARRIGKVGLQQALEFDERLFKEDNVVDAIQINLACVQTVLNGLAGKARVMLLAAKALLLSGRDDGAVLNGAAALSW